MKKLTTLFAIVALSTTLGLAGCKKKKGEEGKDDTAAKPMDNSGGDMKKDDKGAAPAPAPGGEMKKDDTAAAPAGGAAPAAGGGGDLPKECQDYKAAIDKLATCDKMPAASRDAMKSAYDQASATWEKMPADAKAGLAGPCKQGADAVMQTGKASCGW